MFTILKVKVPQSCQTLCDHMDYTVHGILKARILKWVAFPFFGGFSQPRDRTHASCIAVGFFTSSSLQGSLRILEWVAYPFSSRSSRLRNQTGVTCTAGGPYWKHSTNTSCYYHCQFYRMYSKAKGTINISPENKEVNKTEARFF